MGDTGVLRGVRADEPRIANGKAGAVKGWTENTGVYLVMLVLFTTFAVAPLLRPGFFYSHDSAADAYTLFEFDRNTRDGIFLPRWAPAGLIQEGTRQ